MKKSGKPSDEVLDSAKERVSQSKKSLADIQDQIAATEELIHESRKLISKSAANRTLRRGE